MTQARKTMLITGGSRGIGAATARLAARDGWNVMISFASAREAADAVVKDCRAAGAEAFATQADTGRIEDIERLFSEAKQRFGALDGLVNNAGVTSRSGRLEDASIATIQNIINVNVTGAILVARAAIPLMSRKHGARGGAMVNLSSAAATLGLGNVYVWYSASKGAIDSLTIGLGQELAADGIRVNAVAPGLIATDIHAATGDPDRANKIAHTVPLGRVGTPEEVADAILYLMSEKASYITGHVLRVGGGR